MEKSLHTANKSAKLLEESKALGKKRLKLNIKNNLNKEGFSFRYAGGNFYLDAENPSSAIFALEQLQISLVSGHQTELMREWNPKFSLRPLWIGSEIEISVSSDISLFISNELYQAAKNQDSFAFERFCKNVLSLGYNSILLGKWKNNFSSESQQSKTILESIFSNLTEYGLKIIIKPQLTYPLGNRTVLDQKYADFVQNSIRLLAQQLPTFTSLFWESECWNSDYQEHSLSREMTHADLVRQELSLLQNCINPQTSLIYFVSSHDDEVALQQAAWLPEICDDMKKNVIMAFSAVSGDIFSDHLAPHPFWEALRRSPDISSTPIMPIVNTGSILQGEGLWPAFPCDLIEKYISTCYRHNFLGIISLTNRIPTKGTFLHGNLWLASQVMWGNHSLYNLLQTWFSAERKDLNFEEVYECFGEIRSIILQLSYLRSNENKQTNMTQEECRCIVESILAKLKLIQMLFEKRSKSFLDEYVVPFIKDARLITLKALQNLNMPLLHLKKEEDAHGGYWVEGLTEKMGHFRSAPKQKN